MSLSRRLLLAGLLAGAAHTPLLAQKPAASAAISQSPWDDPEEEADFPAAAQGGEIIVTGTRLRGQAASDIPPEVQLDEKGSSHTALAPFPSCSKRSSR